MKPRVQIKVLGCRVNEAEAEQWAEQFQAAGCQIVAENQSAEVIILNTCAVTQEAARKSRQIVRRLHRKFPQANLIVSGCLATLEHVALTQEPGVIQVIGNIDKDNLVSKTIQTIDFNKIINQDSRNSLQARGRQRAFIKVQDGCQQKCTFCVTNLVRGPERSISSSEIVNKINYLSHNDGILEIVLTGVQLGGYGRQWGGNLAGLLRTILAETDIPRIRLGSLEPWGLNEDFWEVFAQKRLMPHLHLSIQSGSDRILRRMARRGRRTEFDQIITAGRLCRPELNITVDILVGFPGETDEDWNQTLELIKLIDCSHVHIFKFSSRPGTAASNLLDPIDNKIKQKRCDQLRELAAQIQKDVLKTQVGQCVALLCEGPVRGGAPSFNYFGYTPNFLPVQFFTSNSNLTGQIVAVKLTGLDTSETQLIGNLINPIEIAPIAELPCCAASDPAHQ